MEIGRHRVAYLLGGSRRLFVSEAADRTHNPAFRTERKSRSGPPAVGASKSIPHLRTKGESRSGSAAARTPKAIPPSPDLWTRRSLL